MYYQVHSARCEYEGPDKEGYFSLAGANLGNWTKTPADFVALGPRAAAGALSSFAQLYSPSLSYVALCRTRLINFSIESQGKGPTIVVSEQAAGLGAPKPSPSGPSAAGAEAGRDS